MVIEPSHDFPSKKKIHPSQRRGVPTGIEEKVIRTTLRPSLLASLWSLSMDHGNGHGKACPTWHNWEIHKFTLKHILGYFGYPYRFMEIPKNNMDTVSIGIVYRWGISKTWDTQ